MAQVVLGVNNGFASRRWPEPSAWAKVIAEDLGLREVQFSFDLLDPTMPEPGRSAQCRDVLRAAGEFGLSLRTTMTGSIAYARNHLAHPNPLVRAHALDWYAHALETTAGLSAEASGGHIGAMSAADAADPARRAFLQQEMVEAVRALTHVAAAHGQTYFMVEPMPTPREFPHTIEDATRLLEAANDGAAVPVRLCFDVGHCITADTVEDPHAWLEQLLPWSPVVHLQQTDGKADRHWAFSPEHDASGIVRPRRIVEIVKASPLERVSLLFEFGYPFDTPDQQIIDELKRSVAVWAECL